MSYCSLSDEISLELIRIREEINGTRHPKWTKTGKKAASRLKKIFQPIYDDDELFYYETIIYNVWTVVDDLALGIHWRGRTPPLKELLEALTLVKQEREQIWFVPGEDKYNLDQDWWDI